MEQLWIQSVIEELDGRNKRERGVFEEIVKTSGLLLMRMYHKPVFCAVYILKFNMNVNFIQTGFLYVGHIEIHCH